MLNVFKKKMSLWGVVSIGIGSMLGAGIFALLGQVVLLSGSNVYLAFSFAGAVAMLSGYSYAKLNQYYPNAGGITDYFNQSFQNRLIAGFFSLIYLATLCVSIAMLGRSFGIYATHLFGGGQWMTVNAAAISIIALSILNMKSGTNVGRTEMVLVGLKLSLLIFLIVAGFYQYFFVAVPPVIEHATTSGGFWKGVSFAFFAYAGYGVMTNTAGDVHNPRRTIPIAIFVAIATVAIMYISLAFLVMNYVPLVDLQRNMDTAVAVLSASILGSYGFTLISIAALLALLSGMNALFFSAYKIMAYMSNVKELPPFLNKKLIGQGTVGMFLITGGVVISSIFFKFGFIATLASSAFLASYIAVFIAHLKLYKKTNSSLAIILLGLASMIFIFIRSLME